MIFIYDFNDSFTYNLYSDLYQYSTVEVIPFSETHNHLLNILKSDDKQVIVLGPGPGHPDEYESLIPLIRELLLKKNIFIFGVCLGHQLIWRSLGLKVKRSSNPVHGQSSTVNVENFYSENSQHTVTMQRYNSLSVYIPSAIERDFKNDGWKIVKKFDELLMCRNELVLTYQFHPESVGSMRKDLLYSPVIEFLL